MLLASSLLCDWPIAGDVRGSGDTAPLSLVTWRQNSLRRCISVEPLWVGWGGGGGGGGVGGGGLLPCYFPIRPSSPTLILCSIQSFHLSSPREEVSEVLPV